MKEHFLKKIEDRTKHAESPFFKAGVVTIAYTIGISKLNFSPEGTYEVTLAKITLVQNCWDG